jgi:hypothetical protein
MSFRASPFSPTGERWRPSLTGAFNVKGQPLAFLDVVWIDACGLQRADVQKHVRATGVVRNEAVTAIGIPHFQGSGRHRVLFPLRLRPRLYKPALIQVALSAGYGMHGPF